MKNLLARIAALAAIVSFLAAQEQETAPTPPCPHQVLHRVPADVNTFNVVRCGTGVSFSIGGVNYTSAANECALLITITPAHDETRHSPGSNTYTEPGFPVSSFVIRYRCRAHTFLWLFPIWSECEEVSFSEGARFDHYRQRRCED